MDLHDTARVRHPRDMTEHRLATVVDVIDNGCTTYIQRYRLRFPSGDERLYPPDAVMACTRDDDRRAIEAAFTAACRSLRDACRIAHDHDHDGDLSAEIVALLATLINTAHVRLGLALDPAALDQPAETEQVTP
jgi:hypothetical protein